ncbi:murein hydrolase activator EnvC family protein [Solimicrobium silvestre]|uniref:Membrane-bound metallopeptidase n=1 Tax=Solimicrobium silvestre TaxID=2099400 RepID=A0A2S9H3A6_9BURK|nr:peptidoglycan DD-metalloendopeptidase family protein [Solimicrobium silvestre]PRC94458.1 Membrane-bound metallopeptidase [Solimicrobium silvestre]
MPKSYAAKLAALALVLAWFTPSWSASPGRDEQKRTAESEHAELRKKLSDLKQDILTTESAKQRAEDSLADSEAAISNANRKLVGLSAEQQQTQQKLTDLAGQQQKLQQQVEQQKKQFSALLRQQYQTGNSDRIQLLLSGDNPNRINRDLQYLGYLSQSQNKLISQLRDNLAAVDKNKLATEQAKQDLDDIAEEQQQQKSDLVKEQTKRAGLIKQLSSKLSAQRKEAGQLQKNEQRLATLVDKLNQLIAEQRKAEQAQQEKRRLAQLALEAKRKAATEAKPAKDAGKSSSTKSGSGTITESAPIQVTKTPEASSDNSQFAQLKGRLRLPTKGELSAKFGSQRGEGTAWKGLFIRANEGAEIKAVASGKVIFAEWLRGFGNLIILDHGSQYMSIYGNNQSVLKQAGDTVSAGEVIATVGNSGGNEQSGLYFELRFQGKAIDPLSWINLK